MSGGERFGVLGANQALVPTWSSRRLDLKLIWEPVAVVLVEIGTGIVKFRWVAVGVERAGLVIKSALPVRRWQNMVPVSYGGYIDYFPHRNTFSSGWVS